MKKLLVAGLCILTNVVMAGPLKIQAQCGYQTDGGTGAANFHPVILSSEGVNSSSFPMKFSWDPSSSIILTLNSISHTCADSDCKTYSGENFHLSLIRLEDNFEKVSGWDKKDPKAKGVLSETIEIGLNYADGKVSVMSIDGDQVVRNGDKFPDIKISYSVKRKLLMSRQTIDFSCQLIRNI